MSASIYPAPDLKGQWIAHCHESDVVTQGNSAAHASEMLREALELMSDRQPMTNPTASQTEAD
jgi:predicted RNase H-like HicB family nuclease